MHKFNFKILFGILLFLNIGVLSAQTKLYQHPEFEQKTKDHKIIAILPFDAKVSLRPKQMKELTEEQFANMQKEEGYSVQTSMYSWFLNRKKRGKLKVDVQDPKKTNALLLQNHVDLKIVTSEQLAEILGVDAVITGTFETDKPMSDGASIALGLVIGFWGTTNTATINMSVNNGLDGELLWNYNKKVAGSLGSNNDALINILMRKASRRLGYTD